LFITLWGNNGKECSFYSLLPSLYFAKRCYDGKIDDKDFKTDFYKAVGIDYDLMLSLDSPNLICGNKDACRNPSEYLFYGDLFNCYISPSLPKGGGEEYEKTAKNLEKGKDTAFGYIFDALSKLCKVLAVKYNLPIEIRTAYENKNIDGLNLAIEKISKCIDRAEEFYVAFEKLWHIENKPYGFEIQDYRIGGMIKRMLHCKNRLLDFVDGKLDKIEELEEPLLPFMENHSEKEVEFTCIPYWKKAATANIF
jgi:hypothetical protein